MLQCGLYSDAGVEDGIIRGENRQRPGVLEQSNQRVSPLVGSEREKKDEKNN